MDQEFSIHLLVILHAIFGGVALLGGTVVLFMQKGTNIHKKIGFIFYYGMLLAAAMALIISCLPNHENAFLFSIGIFTSYLVIVGRRALSYRFAEVNLVVDKWVSYTMMFTSITMIIGPIISIGKINIVLSVFGLIGFILSWRDSVLYKDQNLLRKNAIAMHIGKILGAYIAATTAFIVVNQMLPGLYGWLLPTALGFILISFYIRKEKTSKMEINGR